jgi:hypothetical protein
VIGKENGEENGAKMRNMKENIIFNGVAIDNERWKKCGMRYPLERWSSNSEHRD